MSSRAKLVNKLKECLQDLKQEDGLLHSFLLKKVISNFDSKIVHDLKQEDHDLLLLLKQLYYYGFLSKSDKKIIFNLVESLHTKLRDIDSNSLSSDSANVLDRIIVDIGSFLSHEISYLDYVPGASNKEYIRLADLLKSKDHALIIDKAKLELRGDSIYFDNRLVQGLKIMSGTVFLVGEHYSSDEQIHKIYDSKRIVPSSERVFSFGLDPYCYLAETGLLFGKSEREIKKILGAASAESCITVKIIVSPVHVWLRLKRDCPVKFAIESSSIPFEAPKRQKGFRIMSHGIVEYWAA